MDAVTAPAASPGTVREVDMPPEARALTTLPRLDYEDAFIADVGAPYARTGEQWARAMLEDAPATTRVALRRGWCALGLRLGSTRDERRVLGWELRRNAPDFALLHAGSRLGLEGEVLFKPQHDGLLFATFVQLRNPIARAVWARIAPGHQGLVRHLLEQTGRAA
jgi:hypothetical protein